MVNLHKRSRLHCTDAMLFLISCPFTKPRHYRDNMTAWCHRGHYWSRSGASSSVSHDVVRFDFTIKLKNSNWINSYVSPSPTGNAADTCFHWRRCDKKNTPPWLESKVFVEWECSPCVNGLAKTQQTLCRLGRMCCCVNGSYRCVHMWCSLKELLRTWLSVNVATNPT